MKTYEDLREEFYPVTLREVREFGIELDSQFGIDEEEEKELLDDSTILRIRWYEYRVDEYEECEIKDAVEIQCLDSSLVDYMEGNPPTWKACWKQYSHPSGYVAGLKYSKNYDRVYDLYEKKRKEGLIFVG